MPPSHRDRRRHRPPSAPAAVAPRPASSPAAVGTVTGCHLPPSHRDRRRHRPPPAPAAVATPRRRTATDVGTGRRRTATAVGTGRRRTATAVAPRPPSHLPQSSPAAVPPPPPSSGPGAVPPRQPSAPAAAVVATVAATTPTIPGRRGDRRHPAVIRARITAAHHAPRVAALTAGWGITLVSRRWKGRRTVCILAWRPVCNRRGTRLAATETGAGLSRLRRRQARGSVGCDGDRHGAQCDGNRRAGNMSERDAHIENIGCDVMIPRSSITIGCGEDRGQFRAQSRLSGP